jgi:hypothetical protein
MDNRQSLGERTLNRAVLAVRLRLVRIDLFGEEGGQELADQLGIPLRTWFNYECGVAIPGDVLLEFLEITGIQPIWLLRGLGPIYCETMTEPSATEASAAHEPGHPAPVLRLHKP